MCECVCCWLWLLLLFVLVRCELSLLLFGWVLFVVAVVRACFSLCLLVVLFVFAVGGAVVCWCCLYV